MALNIEEIRRYNRHIIMPEFGMVSQEKLKTAKVLVVGAGGLGAPVLLYLTAAGVGTIGVVDFDTVDESNLQRQVLYSENDVGKPKVDCAVQELQKRNSHVNFVMHKEKLTENNAIDIIKEYDIIVDGTDNFPTRYLVNDACLFANRPYVYGAIHKFEGQVSVFNYAAKGEAMGPTYRCIFPEPPLPGQVPNCSEAGVIGVLPGIIGSLQANEVIKIITGIGVVLSGKLWTFNTLNNEVLVLNISRDIEATNAFLEAYTDVKEINYHPVCETHDDKVKSISVDGVLNKLESNVVLQLIDVREPDEYMIININAELMPLSELDRHSGKIKKDIPVIIHCQSGMRSRDAIIRLQEKYRFSNLYNLEGGLNAWLNKTDKTF